MNILSALIAISFLVSTFIGASQLFLKADRHLLKQQDQFVELTKKQLKRGSISMVGALIGACLSAMLLFYAFRMKLEFRESQYREKNYLCFLFLNNETSLYVKRMAQINLSLRALYILKKTSIQGMSTSIFFESLKEARNLMHFNYLSQIAKNKFCNLPYTKDYFTNFPYLLKNNIELDVNEDETSKLRSKRWNNFVWQSPQGVRMKKIFCLKTYFELSSSFSQIKILETQELEWGETLKSKCWFG